jgi:ABC-type nitrate/sulfonate/bicarbonate transport system substrate-binding protein
MRSYSHLKPKVLRSFKGFVFFGVLFALAGLLTGCDNPLSQDKKNTYIPSEDRLPISISVPEAPVNWLTLIAVEQGFFSDEGLDVTPKYYPSGKRALAGMFAGEVDLATVAKVPIVFSSFDRQDFSILATLGSTDNSPKIIARKDRGIQKRGDLKGKRIATQGASSAHFFLSSFLTKNRLLKSEVEIVFDKIEKLPELLRDGKVDAVATREPYIAESRELSGDAAILFDEPALYLKSFNLVAFKSFIKSKPRVIQRVLRALLKAEDFMRDHRGEAIKVLAGKLNLPEARVVEVLKAVDLEVRLDQSILLGLEDQAMWAIEDKLRVGRIPNYLNFVDPAPLESILPAAVSVIH